MTLSSSPQERNARFYTLGCKVNQYETQAIREAFERKGIRDAEGDRAAHCEFVVLNTCTVTEDADKTNRYWIRRLRREHPDAKLVVTGCYVKKNRNEIASMSEVDLIYTNDEKADLADLLVDGKKKIEPEAASSGSAFLPLSISRCEGRTRAYVKIQDGCNHLCSYCKVALVRGRSRSRALPEIREEVVRLRDSGYHEIVLTGIQLGAYGLDQKTGDALPAPHLLRDVIECCASIEGIDRIRLSSIELTDLGEPIRDALCTIPKLCPHLHVPLQSGDDEILKRMNRRYTREMYRDVLLELKARVPDLALSVDVMVGFPGETDDQFQNTLDLLKQVRPLKSHIFPYSRREGTRAAAWGILPLQIVKERVRKTISLTDTITQEVRSAHIGGIWEVLVEQKDLVTGFWEGHTANYLKVFFEYPANVQGCMISVQLRELFRDGFFGTVRKSIGG